MDPTDIRKSPSRKLPDALTRELAYHRGTHAHKLGLSQPELLPVLVLPANRTQAVPLPKRRANRLRRHLKELVERIFEDFTHEESDGYDDYDGYSDLDEPANGFWEPAAEIESFPRLEQACATCRGRCCDAGGDDAFLDEITLIRYRQSNPDMGPEEIVSTYLAHLGEESYEGSCVYHGEFGCYLPRSMRAEICNTFLCTPLGELRSKYPHGPVLGAAVHGERLIRLAIID